MKTRRDEEKVIASSFIYPKDALSTSTPKRKNKGIAISGNACDIVDRYIPQQTSHRAYNAAHRLRTIDFEASELSESTRSPSYLTSSEFFSNLRFTRNYSSITTDSNADAPKKDEKSPLKQKLHRRYIADALGFHVAERVYHFSASDPNVSNSESNTLNSTSTSHTNVDPMLSILPPKKLIRYLTMQAFSNSLRSRSLVPMNQRPTKRTKSHVPYRVLDAPSLRNDFYSNLVSWSRISGNIVVGLGCAVYIWSDTRGAINVLHYSYLQPNNDIVTCVSFSPYNDLLLVGTKQGRLLLFTQGDDPDEAFAGGFKPLCISNDATLKGVCCIEWFKSHDKNVVLVGEESGDVHVIQLECVHEELCEIRCNDNLADIGMTSPVESNDNRYRDGEEASTRMNQLPKIKRCTTANRRWIFVILSKFKAQNQQVCGLSYNDATNQLAVGGNDNACTIWDTTNLSGPRLQFVLPHKAAVKAVAFCPWSKSLLATGGGSKDRTIRFWHTQSGTLLQHVKAPGQITSLIWSVKQKQIVATFGFGDLERPTLVTVYSYPLLQPLTEVHSSTALRVLSAVPSPDFSSICIATNDETVRFYELWSSQQSTIMEAQQQGIYGSELIEFSEGINKNDKIIR